MWSNFFKPKERHVSEEPAPKPERRWKYLLILPVWVIVSFLLANLAIIGLVNLLVTLQVSFVGVSEAVLTTILSVIIYALTLLIVAMVPYWVKKVRTTREELGATRLPTWTDILLAPAGLLLYLVLTGILSSIAAAVIPWYDANQVQETGFRNFHAQYEYILAFVSLVVLAPVAEEILFRGYLLGKLKKYVPIWVAVVMTSLVFGVAHGAWNVGVDVFALSLVLCTLRLVSGSIWAPILLHMAKNMIAFYLLFINPTLLTTIGG